VLQLVEKGLSYFVFSGLPRDERETLQSEVAPGVRRLTEAM
jgi:hypothetical protein